MIASKTSVREIRKVINIFVNLSSPRESDPMAEDREANFAWVSNQNLSEFEGKWICVVDQKLVSSGDNAAEVVKSCREQHPKNTPFLMKVPAPLNYTM